MSYSISSLCFVACLFMVGLLASGTASAHGGLHDRLGAISKQIESHPQDAQLYLQRAEVYRQHEEWKEALADCDTALKLDPAIEMDLLLGRILLESGSADEALPLLDGFVKRHPDHPQAVLCRARAFTKLDQSGAAIADYRKAMVLTAVPEPDLIQEVADALASQGQTQEAVQVLAVGIGKVGAVPSLVLRAMDLEISIKDFDAALTRVDAMRKTAPRPEPWMAKRASILAQAGRIPESLASWQALVEHLDALPNLERGSHAMSQLMQEGNATVSSPDQIIGLDNVTIQYTPSEVILPPVVTSTAPADEVTGIGSSTTLRVSVADPEHAATTVTFYGRKTTPLAPGPDFTLMTLPDTQFYSQNTGGQRADTYHAQTQWITDNRDTLNVAFVSHMGDIVQNGDFNGNPIQWKIADAAMKRIENQAATLRPYGIPWGGAPGNHDLGSGSGSGTSLFYNQYFGVSRYAGRNYFGGNYGVNNNNNYQLFSASGLDFIILHLEYNADSVASYQAVLDWAGALLKAHPNRRAIVTSHWMVNTGNPATFSTQGQAIYDNLKDNPNLFLLLGGHIHGEGQRSDVFSGRTVHSVLQDYQDRANGGDGWLRYFIFSPASNTISAKTYRVANTITPTALFETDADSQFTLPYNMQSAVTDWIPLGTVNVPAGSTVANLSWTGLQAGSRYEWYACASDGISTGTGATRRLSTAAPGYPTVNLTNPAGGTSYALPATVAITATAGGSVARVEFFAGNTKLGEDTAAPYEFNWSNPPPGTHLLTAVASDSSNRVALSNTISISSITSAP